MAAVGGDPIGPDHDLHGTRLGDVRPDPLAGDHRVADAHRATVARDPVGTGQSRTDPHPWRAGSEPLAADQRYYGTQSRAVGGDLLGTGQSDDDALGGYAGTDPHAGDQRRHEPHCPTVARDPLAADQQAGDALRLGVGGDPLGTGQAGDDTHIVVAGPDPSPPTRSRTSPVDPLSGEAIAARVGAIRVFHRRARFVQRQRVALGNAFLAFVRLEVLGVSSFSPEAERARAAKVSAGIRKQLASGQPPSTPGVAIGPDLAAELTGLWLATEASTVQLERIERGYRKEMARLAAGLPGSAFVAGLKGFALPGFALLLGEVGEPGAYANPAKVWKRLGLAVIDGKRQTRHCDAVLAELHGYCPSRRSVSWVVFDSLFRHQREGDRYRAVYDAAKAAYLERGWTRLHAHKAAKRKAEKVFVLDLWRAWRREAGVVEEPPAEAWALAA